MMDVEQGLRDLAAHVDFPETPDFAPALSSALIAGPLPLRRRSWPRLVLVAAAAVLVLALAALAYPPTRDGVARFLHLRGLTIERRSSFTPPPPATTPGTPSLGDVVSLDQARNAANFKLRTPAVLSARPTVRLLRVGSQPVVSLEYDPSISLPDPHKTGIGLLATEFRGDLVPYLGKFVGPDTTLEEVAVDGVSGFWLAGAPHAIGVLGPEGIRLETLRLAENTLVWERDGVTYRIESALSRPDTLRIAASLR